MRTIKIIIIAVLISFVFLGCRSKKYKLEKSRTELETKNKLDSVNFSKVYKGLKTNETITSKETDKEESVEYNGKAGDSLKIIKIENGKVISETIYTGTGKATLKSKEKTENKDLKKNESTEKTEDNKISVKKEETIKAKELIKTKTIEKSGFTFMTYLWIFLIITAIVAGWYLNKRFNFIAKIKGFLKLLT